MKNDLYTEFPSLRSIIIIFLSIALIICVSFTALYVVYDVKLFKYLLYLYTIQHILWLVGFLRFKNIHVETIIMLYISYVMVVFYPVACVYWNSGNPVVFSWYLLIMFGVIVFQMRSIGFWISTISITVISVFFCSRLFPQEDFTPSFTFIANVFTVISTIILSAFFAIVYCKKISYKEFLHTETSQTKVENVENPERDKALYNNIINYLETNKPFKNPDFNAHTLAMALNSNVTYISKAISTSDSGNFNMLLNHFRVNYVKSMLDNGALKKYTLDYIQAEAGYKHRSTFNTAFKSITGMTPSEYASQHNSHDNS